MHIIAPLYTYAGLFRPPKLARRATLHLHALMWRYYQLIDWDRTCSLAQRVRMSANHGAKITLLPVCKISNYTKVDVIMKQKKACRKLMQRSKKTLQKHFMIYLYIVISLARVWRMRNKQHAWPNYDRTIIIVKTRRAATGFRSYDCVFRHIPWLVSS